MHRLIMLQKLIGQLTPCTYFVNKHANLKNFANAPVLVLETCIYINPGVIFDASALYGIDGEIF